MAFAVLFVMSQIAGAEGWGKGFEHQPVDKRPALDVRYTDGTRSAFEIAAETYRLIGELRSPHRLIDAETREPWLWLETASAGDGSVYSSLRAEPPSRINLYRRGPYFCEVHWLDIQLADEQANLAPLKGDLALYCYPDKLLASITWHAIEDFEPVEIRTLGVSERRFDASPFKKGSKQTFAFPLFAEDEPLPGSAFVNLEAVAPMRYDATRGCYTIGSLSTGGFQGHFFHHPNRYERTSFRVTNKGPARTIYVCHENTGGDRGSVEGGVLLDEAGHPLPITVQISKNFAGEKEEKFYNPHDTPFSETYFPLHLGKNETRTVTSLHLYQNWGRHMVKQFSSLGAWMDYFHSSTGVTETTCYVPFKFAGLPGVAIADFRAMSQASFWGGQPQHDNVAGHSFLSYKTGDDWQYMVYRGTTYRSTGPNWMDIGLEYVSTDGKVRATVDTFELPQADELRNFIRVRYEVLDPMRVENATENFRLLTVASWVQRLRYTHFAATGMDDQRLDFSADAFGVRGVPLPRENAFLAVYGETKGSNAIVLRNWTSATCGPAASVWCEQDGDTRLLLVPDTDRLSLEPGDSIEFEAFWLPYGQVDGAGTPRREADAFGTSAPQVPSIARGKKRADFPPTVRARGNAAEFTVQGGRDLIPVIVTGLKDYRWPRIYRKESTGWRLLPHGRVDALDGGQVFCAEDNSFGAVFLIHSDSRPQRVRVVGGEACKAPSRIALSPKPAAPGDWDHIARIQAPWMAQPVALRFPETLNTDALDFIDHKRDDMPPRTDPEPLSAIWHESEGGSLWFEWQYDNQVAGGRLSPNEDDVDLEFWVSNRREASVNVHAQFCAVLARTMFEDKKFDRTWLYTAGVWKKMSDTDRGAGDPSLCHYPMAGGPPVHVPLPWGKGGETADIGVAAVTSADSRYVFAIAWPNAGSILSNAHIPCVHADPRWPPCPPGRRVHVRGKIYLLEGTLDDVIHRVKREIGPLCHGLQ